jgi:hypothetical protein
LSSGLRRCLSPLPKSTQLGTARAARKLARQVSPYEVNKLGKPPRSCANPNNPSFVWNLLFSVRHVCEIHTHIRESRNWFSVQRSQRGVAGTISPEIPGHALARSTSSALGSSLGSCPSSAVCGSELEKMAAKLRQKSLESTARPAEELAVRHQYVIAHSRVLDTPREILASTRAQGVTYLHVAGSGGKWRKPADGNGLQKGRRRRSGTSGGQVPGRKSNARCRNASYRIAPSIVTIILHGAGVTVKWNIPAAGCVARKAP